MKPVRIEISQLPPASSSPNYRGHWGPRYRASEIYHHAVFYCCVDARNKGYLQGMSFPFIKARVDLTFIFPNYRRRDRDNCLSRAKPGIDALVDAGLLLDDDSEHLEIGRVDILVDPQRAPLTIMEIENDPA